MKGLFDKYKISKTDGTPSDSQALYFVLRLDTDPIAREAAWAYINSALLNNDELTADLGDLLLSLANAIPASPTFSN